MCVFLLSQCETNQYLCSDKQETSRADTSYRLTTCILLCKDLIGFQYELVIIQKSSDASNSLKTVVRFWIEDKQVKVLYLSNKLIEKKENTCFKVQQTVQLINLILLELNVNNYQR